MWVSEINDYELVMIRPDVEVVVVDRNAVDVWACLICTDVGWVVEVCDVDDVHIALIKDVERVVVDSGFSPLGDGWDGD